MAKTPLVDDLLQCLQKCRRNRDLQTAKLFHERIRKHRLESHEIVGNYLVPTLVDCGGLPDAQEAFNLLIRPNEVSWTSLIQGYVDRGEAEHGLHLYRKMQEHFVYPSKYTFLVMLKACIKIHSNRKGFEIHSDIILHGLDDNCFIGNSLVDMYAKCGAILESQEVFNGLSVRDVVSWNALIIGYTENGFGKEALICLKQMQEEGTLPDVTTFLCSLKACSSVGAMHYGMHIHLEIVKEEFESDLFIGNSLIDMYAKCGFLTDAEAIFDEIPIRDLVSWNALISGYAVYEEADKVLDSLQEMQQEGISPNTATFVRILQACTIGGTLEEGHQFHMEITQRGFDTEFFVGNTLVDVYSKCGSFEDARKVFEQLPERDVVSWNSLIAGYSGNGYGEDAMKCLSRMRIDGVSPDSVTLSSSLKACHLIGSFDKGRELHAEVVKKGYQGNVFAYSSLVDLYSKCNSLPDAQYVFDRLIPHDSVSWNALISGYADQGLNKEALDCLEQMKCEGLQPDPGTFVRCLQASIDMGDIGKILELHAEIIRDGFEQVPCIGSALVNMYAKNGLLTAAQDVFDEQLSHEVTSWTALVAGYAENGLDEDVANCLECMLKGGVSPNLITFLSILKPSNDGSFTRGHEHHIRIIKMGFEQDSCIGSALMTMYVKCGKLLEACEMFERLPAQDVISWTALIGGYTEEGLGNEALRYLEDMQEKGFSLDFRTYVYCLQACGNVEAADVGQEFHSEIIKKGFEEDIYLGNALLDMYAKCGMLVELRQVFDKLQMQDLISWTSLIGGYAECGHGQQALICFYDMQSKGIYPDAVAWNTVISGYLEFNDNEKVLELFFRMKEEGFPPDSSIWINILKTCKSAVLLDVGKRMHAQLLSVIEHIDVNLQVALIEMYSKCGNLYHALKLFDSMSQNQFLAWNSLIVGYAIRGETNTVFFLVGCMLEASVQPDGETFCSILIACAHAGLLTESLKYFELIMKGFKVIPNIRHHTCIVDLLGRSGQLEDAILVLQEMPFQPDLVLLRAILGACRRWGNVELGEGIFEFAVNLNEMNSAAYVLMSNIYVDHCML